MKKERISNPASHLYTPVKSLRNTAVSVDCVKLQKTDATLPIPNVRKMWGMLCCDLTSALFEAYWRLYGLPFQLGDCTL